ncbi:class II aldolase and Adducin N-terminal domain-containing protein [Lophiotrema nucula]|uniref:Class II aldolase and Adducin N-terminal domain-containing protein n=1 Tax=Lophiotrema nucula TaxID=690887 RepID=A0A6A5YVR9_9PLEO|nr:class II aldolase and Adducin N-terminal domain-containing protein [Lophiotrema nucula]
MSESSEFSELAQRDRSLSDSKSEDSALKTQLQLLISANHILHHHNLVDAFGHISIRNPVNPSEYIIAAYDPGAPALVSKFTDLITYHVSDSTPVDPNAAKGYSERYIHGEIFARWPEVNCVIHSHSEAVIPFMTSNIQIKPVFHMAGFLGAEGPRTFDVTKLYTTMDKGEYSPDMLIKSAYLGQSLAQGFRESGKDGEGPAPVVLQHKHGFTCVGESIQRAVYRAIYLQKNCELLQKSIGLMGDGMGSVSYLTEEEAEGCRQMNELTEDKAFRLWLREVEVNPLYHNAEGVPRDLPVGGMKDVH